MLKKFQHRIACKGGSPSLCGAASICPKKGGRNLPRKKLSAAVIAVTAAAVLFSGCRGENPDQDVVSYHVFSEGTYIEVFDGYSGHSKKNSDADFYIPNGMVTSYLSRNSLTESEQEVYDQILKDLGTFQEWAPLTVGSDVYGRLLDLIRLEQLSYIQVSARKLEYHTDVQSYGVAFTYRYTADDVSSMNIAVEHAAKEIFSNITSDMDDYEKLKYFHDYLVLNCETSADDEFADTVYGALVRGKAHCEGYSKAFSYLCNLAGIENVLVTGETYVPHMWNMVKLGGNWYHVDVTWDDPDDQLHENFPDVILYQYFMVTDSVIENNHVIYSYPAELPKAYGKTENYFVREGTDIRSAEEFLTASENAIMSAVGKGEHSAMIKFETSDTYISITSDLADKPMNEVFDPIISRVKSTYGTDIRLSLTEYYGQYRILTYIIEY